jgi:hypothetical protein
MNLKVENLIDFGNYDYDNPNYVPVEDWFFEPADALGLVVDEDYLIVYDTFPLKPYGKQSLLFIKTIMVTFETAIRVDDYFVQRAMHYRQLADEIQTSGKIPEDDTFVYDSSKYQPVDT